MLAPVAYRPCHDRFSNRRLVSPSFCPTARRPTALMVVGDQTIDVSREFSCCCCCCCCCFIGPALLGDLRGDSIRTDTSTDKDTAKIEKVEISSGGSNNRPLAESFPVVVVVVILLGLLCSVI